MNFDFSIPVPEGERQCALGTVELEPLGLPCHGAVLWMDYCLTESMHYSTGLLEVCVCLCVRVCFLLPSPDSTHGPAAAVGPHSQASSLLPPCSESGPSQTPGRLSALQGSV